MHQIIHQRNSKLFYQLLEILTPLLRKTMLPSFSIVKYFCNQLELSSKINKIPLHQIIHEKIPLFYQLLEILTPLLRKTMLPSFSIVKYFCNQLESSSKSNKIPLHKLIHEGNSIIFYLLLEILRAWLRKTKLPSFSIVKYFSNQLELTSKRDKIQLHQIIHERNSRIFYQLLDILKPRLWERSCHRSPPSNISANNLN